MARSTSVETLLVSDPSCSLPQLPDVEPDPSQMLYDLVRSDRISDGNVETQIAGSVA